MDNADFLVGFAAHAHTMNELETDQQKELELRRKSSPEEAQKLTAVVLDKLEEDLSEGGYSLDDVKLLILYLSYRGEPSEKDQRICESILRAIETRFKKHVGPQLRLIGHTTAGELENEDLVLTEISGVGYNGLSIMALVTNLPIGVGRTWGLRTAEEAREQGREMARDAWVDLNQQTTSKDHLRMKKTQLVLTQGSKVDTPGHEHFLAEGIAQFMGSTREARIMNVAGGSSGDGVLAKRCRQFYGRLKEHPQFKILEGEAVCALIPSLGDISVGLDVSAITKIGRQHTFHFNSEKEPHYKYVKRIGNQAPFTKYAEAVYENEVKLAKERGLPMPNKEAILEAARLSRARKRLLIFNPVVAKYAFAFPFGNYACVAGVRVLEDDIELMFPIRSYTPEMPGYIMMGDHDKVRKGAHQVYNMLREDQGFRRNDVTFLVSCINRRIVELMAGCKTGTEAEILKEGLLSTQAIGFLAYGEVAFTHLMQEPYFHAFSCWGITLHSKTAQTQATVSTAEAPPEIPTAGRITTGYKHLDRLLGGGIPEQYAVALDAPSCDERELLIRTFLESGARQGDTTFYLAADPGAIKTLAKEYPSNFYLFVCNPNADAIVESAPNVSKLKGVENLVDINIALTTTIRTLAAFQGPRRICMGLVSDVLLHHHSGQARRWLSALIPELKSAGFTTLAVVDPKIHPPEELHAILGLFDGEISLYERETTTGTEKYLKIKKLTNQKYSDSELALKREYLQKLM
jgi:KaiC/GvpD/RAD55 family RecA-like ATPase